MAESFAQFIIMEQRRNTFSSTIYIKAITQCLVQFRQFYVLLFLILQIPKALSLLIFRDTSKHNSFLERPRTIRIKNFHSPFFLVIKVPIQKEVRAFEFITIQKLLQHSLFGTIRKTLQK